EELTLTTAAIAAVVGGRLVGERPDRAVTGFSIDTRTLQPGDLFFAIRGDRFDGRAFLADALNAGAAGAVVSEPPVVEMPGAGAPLIVVSDAIGALQSLASHVRKVSAVPVVAVTGSAGKSTTKEIAA